LTEKDIAKIADTYHAWKETLKVSSPDSRGGLQDTLARQGDGSQEKPLGSGVYQDIPGFCRSVPLKEIQEQGYVLTPGRYVGAAELEEDDEPFEEKMRRLTQELEGQFEESDKLGKTILKNVKNLSFPTNE
jgi:type I restriction enzyme M protein